MDYPEVAQLDAIRLEQDLSYRALAAKIGIPEKTVFRLLTEKHARVYDRTLFKIRRFLATEEERGAGPRSEKAATR